MTGYNSFLKISLDTHIFQANILGKVKITVTKGKEKGIKWKTESYYKIYLLFKISWHNGTIFIHPKSSF